MPPSTYSDDLGVVEGPEGLGVRRFSNKEELISDIKREEQ
jgi:hypothetical protein